MELIYTNANRFEMGVTEEFSLDLDVADTKDFELKIDEPSKDIDVDSWIYIADTEYGGRIDSKTVDTATKETTFKGRNFRGILNSKIICPPDGADYMEVQGLAYDIVDYLITYASLEDLFVVDQSELEVQYYAFERYTTVYDGIVAMLDEINASITMSYNVVDGKVHIIPDLIEDHTDLLTYCRDDNVSLNITSQPSSVNHLICLGSGELAERKVIHLFADKDGGIQDYAKVDEPMQDSDYILDTSRQVCFGLDEYAVTYDYENANVTYNYLMTTKKPSDWSTNYADYFTLEEPEDSGDEEDETEISQATYKAVEGVTTETYTVQTSRPSDWSTNCEEYYEKDGSEYTAVQASEEETGHTKLSKKPSDWKTNYSSYEYRYNDGVSITYPNVSGVNYNTYKKQTSKPSDWSTDYGNYYCIKKKKYTRVEGTGPKKNKAPKWKKKKYYTQYSKTKAPSWKKNYYYKPVMGTVIPTWSSGTYYTKTETTKAPTWTKSTYYEEVADNYAELITNGLSQMESYAASDAQDITLEDFEAAIGDVVGGQDLDSGIEVSEKVTNIVVKIEDGVTNIEYTIGGENE